MNRAKDNQTFKESLQHKKGPHRKITGRWRRRGKPGVLQFMGLQRQTRLSDSTMTTGGSQLTTQKNEIIQGTKASYFCLTNKYPNEICEITASIILGFLFISSTLINTDDWLWWFIWIATVGWKVLEDEKLNLSQCENVKEFVRALCWALFSLHPLPRWSHLYPVRSI